MTNSSLNLLQEKYNLRCEEILNHYRLYLKDCDINNDEDFERAPKEAGITRARINSYLLALSDADIITEYTMTQAMEICSTAITTMYDLWLDETTF